MDKAAHGLQALGIAAQEGVKLATVVLPQWFRLAERAIEVAAHGVEVGALALENNPDTASVDKMRAQRIAARMGQIQGEMDAPES